MSVELRKLEEEIAKIRKEVNKIGATYTKRILTKEQEMEQIRNEYGKHPAVLKLEKLEREIDKLSRISTNNSSCSHDAYTCARIDHGDVYSEMRGGGHY